jgi:hypothetical protein
VVAVVTELRVVRLLLVYVLSEQKSCRERNIAWSFADGGRSRCASLC